MDSGYPLRSGLLDENLPQPSNAAMEVTVFRAD